jgi:hypothetical protein
MVHQKPRQIFEVIIGVTLIIGMISFTASIVYGMYVTPNWSVTWASVLMLVMGLGMARIHKVVYRK